MQIHVSFRANRLSLLLLSVLLLALCSCQPHRDASIDTFGELDSSMVAADTTMQINMDRSYEYQKSLPENDSVVYDFFAYDKPKGSSSPDWEYKFIVMRRTRAGQDTIIKQPRHGKVKSVWLSDLNHNGKPEIYFYTRSEEEMKKVQDYALFGFETNGRNKAGEIATTLQKDLTQYDQVDSFFTYDDFLIRKVSYRTEKQLWQSYILRDKKLVLSKEKKVSQ